MSNPVNPNSEKALPHVVTALIAKRAELAGQIEYLQSEVICVTVALDHIDASLRLFAPDIDIGAISTRPVPPAHHAFRGEVSRIILETLRKADRPLSTIEITEGVMSGRGLNLKDAKLRQIMGKRVGASLNHWRRVRGALDSIKGPGQVLYWHLKRADKQAAKGVEEADAAN